jgi:hypothetical protein
MLSRDFTGVLLELCISLIYALKTNMQQFIQFIYYV